MKHSIQPLVSIIVPIYNAGKTLAITIESVIRQTSAYWELILIDDGSEDNSSFLCDSFSSGDSRIHAFHQANQGPYQSRKNGVAYSSGSYVVFLDADDYLEPNSVETIYAKIQSKPEIDIFQFYSLFHCDGGVCDYSQGASDHIESSLSFLEKCFQLGGVFAGVWGKAFKRELLSNSLFPEIANIRWTEDLLMVVDATLQARAVAICKETLYHYCRDANEFSITRDISANDLLTECLVLDQIYAVILQQDMPISKKTVIDIKKRWFFTLCNFLSLSGKDKKTRQTLTAFHMSKISKFNQEEIKQCVPTVGKKIKFFCFRLRLYSLFFLLCHFHFSRFATHQSNSL